MIQEHRLVGATIPSRTLPGFSLYTNTIHNMTIQYPSTWNEQEILLNNGHTGVEVMFVDQLQYRSQK